MSLSDELGKLADLHHRGALTDDEYTRAKERLLHPSLGTQAQPVLSAVNALRRSRDDRWIAGVCGGLAKSTAVESWVWRLVFALLLLFGGAGLLVYVLMWIFVPAE